MYVCVALEKVPTWYKLCKEKKRACTHMIHHVKVLGKIDSLAQQAFNWQALYIFSCVVFLFVHHY